MTGNKGTGLVLQPRDQRLLGALNHMRVTDREQSKVVAGFHSTTRANTRLVALTRAGLLSRVRVATVLGGQKFLYVLTKEGARVAGVPYRGGFKVGPTLARNLFLEHQLQLNELYLQLVHRALPVDGVAVNNWRPFRASLSPGAGLIPDAYCEVSGASGVQSMFFEIDMGTESLHRWTGKAQAYLRLAASGEFRRLFHQNRFRVLVLVPSPRRLETVRTTVAKETTKLFWFSTFADVRGAALWSAVYLRPTGPDRFTFYQ